MNPPDSTGDGVTAASAAEGGRTGEAAHRGTPRFPAAEGGNTRAGERGEWEIMQT